MRMAGVELDAEEWAVAGLVAFVANPDIFGLKNNAGFSLSSLRRRSSISSGVGTLNNFGSLVLPLLEELLFGALIEELVGMVETERQSVCQLRTGNVNWQSQEILWPEG